jgi:hypothetical protein
MVANFSDYIVYVDESGDHGLKTIDPNYPVFVLVFCIFHKNNFIEQIVPAIQGFKFKHFGHDQVILHETDIRKDRGDFSILKSKAAKDEFMSELSDIIEASVFTCVSSVIKKEQYRRRYHEPENPYHIALGFGLERVFYYLRSHGVLPDKTHVIVERRGKQEDNELELEFRRICDGGNYEGAQLPLELVFADKKSNSVGLQVADLVARPIGLKILRPEQANRAYEILEGKFYRNDKGNHNGWGLKCFP